VSMTAEGLNSGEQTATASLLYESAAEWVEHYLSLVYWRRLGTRHTWCSQWWLHPEAVVRLEAMWRAWEKMRREDPMTGIARWFIDVCDPMMRELLDPDGPFKGCIETRHRQKTDAEMGLPVAPLPLDL